MSFKHRATAIGLTLAVLFAPNLVRAETNTGTGGIYNCPGVSPTCGDWAAKGANTCRSCQQAQCKSENGKDVIAGNKNTTECYQGHGSPPADTRAPSPGNRRAPIQDNRRIQ